MSVRDTVDRRGIREVVHFTTSVGLLGILDCGFVKSRERLAEDQRLEFILQLNTPLVKDPKWIDFVNLSITHINSGLFAISATRWHPDLSWCILAFDAAVLEHDGVWFVTTNNIYPSARRAQGEAGLEALFAEKVIGRYGTIHRRAPDMARNHTTDIQAEVLYPGQLSTTHLVRVFVGSEEDQDNVLGQIRAVGHREIPVDVVPEPFDA